MAFCNNKILFYCSLLLAFYMMQGCTGTNKMQEEEALSRLNSSANSQYTATRDSSYKINKGDKIEILVWEEPKFNTNTTVSSRGTIAIPLVGEVEVEELTIDQLKETINQELSQYIKGQINLTVSISSSNDMQVSVLGMVTRPDSYSVADETSIFKILSMAGGPNDKANIREVRVYRNNSNSSYTTLDLTKPLETGEISAVMPVYPGDVVYVPQKKNYVREMSLFLRDVSLLFGLFSILNL